MAAVQAFITSAERIIAFDASFKEENQTEGALKLYKSELQDMWDNCRQCYEEVTSASEAEPLKPADSDAISNKYICTFQTYASFFGRINELLKKLTTPVSIDSMSKLAPIGSENHGHGFKLPPCEIEDFKGDYLSWPTFRDLFTAVFIKNPRLSNVEKLYHLLHKTKGDANLLIKRIPLTNDGFELAWKHLMLSYENKRVLTNTQLEIFYKLQPIRVETSESIKTLQRNICSVLESLTLLGVEVSSWDPLIVFHCCQRLPENTLTLWEQTLSNKTSLPSWEALNTFLTARHQTLESVAGMRATTVLQGQRKPTVVLNKQLRSHHTSVNRPSGKICALCQQSHKIRFCERFKAMTPEKRSEWLRSKQMCIRCLEATHTVTECTSQLNCSICSRNHHTMLHFRSARRSVPSHSVPKAPVQLASEEAPSTSEAARADYTIAQSFHQKHHMSEKGGQPARKNVLLGTAIILVSQLGTSYPVRALIDSASEVSFVSNSLRKKLNLVTRPSFATVSGVNEQVAGTSSKLCSLTLKSSMDKQFQIDCDALVLPRITGNLPSFTLKKVDSSAVSKLQLADKEFYRSAPIDILLGGDLYASIVLSGVQRNVLGSLIAQETVFGWILTGHLCPEKVYSYHTTTVTNPTEATIDKQLQQFWEMEEVPKKKHFSASDTYCEELFKKTTWREKDGRYVVSLPFKPEYLLESPLGVSRSLALRQFIRNEANLSKKPDFKLFYDSVLNEYSELDHMEKVTAPGKNELNSFYYLPHHPVIKPESTTTALRVVFNASCSTSNGRSLNDVLYPGPILQADLTFLLLKWRLYRYVLNSDITKMYRQIFVEPSQRRFQRLLYRSDPNGPVEDFQLKTVTFGVNCAPFLAIRTLHQLAEEVFHTHPLASKILRKNMYVDDVLAGYHDISTARLARDQLIEALGTAGFSLRKWTSNNRCILEGIPCEHLLDESFLQFEDASSSKALGVRWNAVRDEFYFSAEPIAWKENFTKREVLSIIAKLFDPAGWLGPVVIVAKIIMQQIWLDKTDWDDVLMPTTLARWQDFVNDYPTIAKFRVPRWIGYQKNQLVQIHGFCDASEKAFAGVIYLRCEQFGAIFTPLFMAKTKVAPVKTVSIPRLELCGALLLSNMVVSLLSELHFTNYQLFCWTDSTIVQAWLNKPPCTWTTFVANRVAKIQESVGIQCWRHVDSKDNPADLGSRGVLASDLMDNNLWWQGPSWLSLCPESWPVSTAVLENTELEAKATLVYLTPPWSLIPSMIH